MSQITTHVLDTALGLPAAGLTLELRQQTGTAWQTLAQGTTNTDGRAPGLLASTVALGAGTYCMHFNTEAYLREAHGTVFYPWVDVVFNLDGANAHYHIPLLLSPFSYSTYRGS